MADGKATRLQRAAEREATLQDHLVLQFETELEGVVRRADRLIGSLVRSLDSEDGQLVKTRASLGRAVRMRKDLTAAMTKAGFRDLADKAISDRFDALAASVLQTSSIAAKAAELTPIHVNSIVALKELRLANLLDWSQAVATDAWRITVDGVLGLRHVDDLVADLGRTLDTSLPKARTLYDTAVSTFSRQVDLLKSTGEATELFYYAGPLDSITRPFCKARIGKVFDRAEIDQMNNGQLPNPLVTGGGYNCRHAFKRVSILDAELKHLHESGDRLPHVAAQLKRMQPETATPARPAARITAFHESPHSFDKFSIAKSGSTTDDGFMGRGLYFSTDERIVRGGKYGYRVELKIDNPLRLELKDWTDDKKALATKALGIRDDSSAVEIAVAAKRQGYDSIVLDYSPVGYKQREVVVFAEDAVAILEKFKKGGASNAR